MTKLSPLLDEYDLSHRHPTNITIHWIAEPLAIFALLALVASASVGGVSLIWPFLVLMLGYFARLSGRVAIAFLPIVAVFLVVIWALNGAVSVPTWQWAVPVFAICWIALLIGHKIEGRVPSVFQNPNLIFVGPAWLMRIVFRRLGLPDP